MIVASERERTRIVSRYCQLANSKPLSGDTMTTIAEQVDQQAEAEIETPNEAQAQTEAVQSEAEPVVPLSQGGTGVNPDAQRLTRLAEIEVKLQDNRDDAESLHQKKEEIGRKIKALDEQYDEMVNEMRAIVRGESLTLFDGVAATPAGKQATAASDDEAWRNVTLDELGITKPKRVEILTEAELTTLGAIADYTNSGKKLADIKGLGKAAVQEIDDAILAYWEKHPREQKKEAAATPDAPIAGALVAIPVADLGLCSTDIEGAYDEATASEAAKRNKPKVTVLMLADRENRFPAGGYVVVSRNGYEYTLLPALNEDGWKALVAKHETEKHEAVKGDLAGEFVTDAEDGTLYRLGGDDEAICVSVSEIYEPGDFGLSATDIASIARIHLLVQAPYAGEGTIPVIENTITVNDNVYIVTQSGVEHGDDVYALRPLLPPTNQGAVPGDPFHHRQVEFAGQVYEIGPNDLAYLVRAKDDGGSTVTS